MPDQNNDIVGVILAGGLSRRMGNQDKSFMSLANKPLFEHVLERFSPQCSTVLINTNKQSKQLASYNLPIIKDTLEGYLGPLAGILAAMQWTKQHLPQTKWIASVPVDTPFLPKDLVSTLYQTLQKNNSTLVGVSSNGRTHPVIGLWSTHLADDLRLALNNEGLRKIDLWTARYNMSHQDFSNEVLDPFFNINSSDDLIQAELLIKQNPA